VISQNPSKAVDGNYMTENGIRWKGWIKYTLPPKTDSKPDQFIYFSSDCITGCPIKTGFLKSLSIEILNAALKFKVSFQFQKAQ
jgi:hypothetical protein